MISRIPHSRSGVAVAAIALAVAACTPAGPKPEQTADAIYAGGDIVTVNDAQPTAEALAVKDGKILAVGSAADDREGAQGRRPRRSSTWAARRCVPGFIDPHSHYINSLSMASQANVFAPPAGPGKDVPSIVAALEAVRRRAPDPRGRAHHGLRLRRERHARAAC